MHDAKMQYMHVTFHRKQSEGFTLRRWNDSQMQYLNVSAVRHLGWNTYCLSYIDSRNNQLH